MAASRAVFLRSLSTLFEAGVPIHEAFELLAQQAEQPQQEALCRQVSAGLAAGHSLPRLLKSQGQAMDAYQVAMIEVGCQTGGLDRVLRRLAEVEEERQGRREQVRGALMYPLITLAICLVALAALPPLALRSILDMFRDSQIELPMLTRAMIWLSDILVWPGFYLILALLVGAAVAWLRAGPGLSEEAAGRLESMLLVLPAAGPLYGSLLSLRFGEALAACLAVGLNPLKALRLAGRASGSVVAAEAAEQAVQRLKEGDSLAQALHRPQCFSPLLLVAIDTGEEAGRLSESLKVAANLLRQELDGRVAVLTALLEPVVMMLIGVLVGLMVLATLMPMSRFLESL